MLILTRKPGESLYIGDSVKITIVEIKGNQIRVGIDAPSELRIYREEIYLQILEENKKAAEGDVSGGALEELSGSWKGVGAGKLGEHKGGRVSRGLSPARPQPEPKILVKKRKNRSEDAGKDVEGSSKEETEQDS